MWGTVLGAKDMKTNKAESRLLSDRKDSLPFPNLLFLAQSSLLRLALWDWN